MTQQGKNPYLAVYDYGQGGIWVVIDARSADEVVAKYPELKVVPDRPPWLTEPELDRIRTHFHFDIDAPPLGWLADLVRARGG